MHRDRRWGLDRLARVRSHASLITVAVALGLGFTAASSTATGVSVSIVGRAYQSATTTVSVGETVTWTNLALTAHTVTALGGTFDSGALSPKESFSVTFSTPGEFRYACTIHPTMKGTVIVRSAQAPQVVQAQLAHRRGTHGGQIVVHVQAPRPGAKVLLELQRGSAWRRVAEARLSSQGKATLSVSSTGHHRLRVVVLGQPGERVLISRLLHSTA